jgi:hypothetical protein
MDQYWCQSVGYSWRTISFSDGSCRFPARNNSQLLCGNVNCAGRAGRNVPAAMVPGSCVSKLSNKSIPELIGGELVAYDKIP